MDKEYVTFRELLDKLEEDAKKKNLRNFINNLVPDGVFGYCLSYIITHPLLLLKHIMLEIKFAWQRVFRGWDDRAVWSIDHHLSRIIPEMMRELKRRSFGIPVIFFEGLVPCDDNYNYSPENEKIAEQRWFDVLDVIIRGFELYHNEKYDMNPDEKAKFEKAFEYFKKYFTDFWW